MRGGMNPLKMRRRLKVPEGAATLCLCQSQWLLAQGGTALHSVSPGGWALTFLCAGNACLFLQIWGTVANAVSNI